MIYCQVSYINAMLPILIPSFQSQATYFNPKHLLFCLEAFISAPFPQQVKTQLLNLVCSLALVLSPKHVVPHTLFTLRFASLGHWRLACPHPSAFSVPARLSCQTQPKFAAPLARIPSLPSLYTPSALSVPLLWDSLTVLPVLGLFSSTRS